MREDRLPRIARRPLRLLRRNGHPEDNAFTRYDKVKILLKDAELVFEPDPDRYMIKGIRSSMIVERVTGNDASVLPVKQKYISELTDEDIYTFVTLRDCEFAVRKGSLTPVHEGYTLADAQGRLNMYPRLIRDNKGSLIHLLTNTTCPYRRNGTRLPYGSGELAGVIVHERFPQYEYVDTADDLANGIIGSYQIRHMSLRRHPLRRRPLAELLGDADRIQLRQGQGRGRRRLRLLVSDVGHQRTLHADRLQVGLPQRRLQCGLLALLGLVRHGARHGSVPQPHRQRRLFGFRRHPRRRHQLRREKHGSQYRRQRHRPSQLAGVGDDLLVERFDRPAYAWVVEFSTAGISSDRVSLIMSVQSGRATLNAGPYFWKVQWSATGDYESDEGWFDVEAAQTAPDGSAYTFTQPDFPVFATQRSWQLPAYKQVEIPLPAEIMGREKVWLRIQPASRLSSGLGFLDGTIPMGYNAAGRWTTWPYATTDNPNSKI